MPDDAHRMSEALQIDIGDILPRLSNEERKVVNLLETTTKKMINAQFAVIFDQTCITENLLPHFANIYIVFQSNAYPFRAQNHHNPAN